MKLHWDGVTWGPPEAERYIYWWNWLPRSVRYWGYSEFWYDGPLPSFGLWFVNITWSPWLWLPRRSTK